MSAFIVSTDHIDYLVSAALAYGRGGYVNYGDTYISAQNATDTGAGLIAENTASVQHRYPDRDDLAMDTATAYRFRPFLHVTPVQTLKAIQCYEYQACEHPGWESSNANRFCEQLRNAAIDNLPGYSEADWEVTR